MVYSGICCGYNEETEVGWSQEEASDQQEELKDGTHMRRQECAYLDPERRQNHSHICPDTEPAETRGAVGLGRAGRREAAGGGMKTDTTKDSSDKVSEVTLLKSNSGEWQRGYEEMKLVVNSCEGRKHPCRRF